MFHLANPRHNSVFHEVFSCESRVFNVLKEKVKLTLQDLNQNNLSSAHRKSKDLFLGVNTSKSGTFLRQIYAL